MRKNKTLVEYPKVSIITCVYNGEKYISKLLDSVLNMGYPNIEHIIVNDGSTDSTEEIVMKYAELYKNKENSNLYIKYIKQENMGLGGATNTGLKQITGEYWTWINCDDWYEPNAFFEPIEILLSKEKLDYVQMNGNYVFEDGNKKVMIDEDNRIHYNNKYRLFVEYSCEVGFKWLLYICKVSSFKNINHSMQIYPSRYTQDEQFICQMFGILNGFLCYNVKWNFYIHSNSYLNRIQSLLRNEYNTLVNSSINQLSVNDKVKCSLINIIRHNAALSQYKCYCVNHRIKDSFETLKILKSIRSNIDFVYKRHLDKKLYLYFGFCLLPFLRKNHKKMQ